MKRQINKVIALALAALTVTLAQPAYATIIADGYGYWAVSGGSKVISDEMLFSDGTDITAGQNNGTGYGNLYIFCSAL